MSSDSFNKRLVEQKSHCHFSVDDVFESLIEVTDQNIPLFDHPMFALLREMHDLYGTQVDLYLFSQKEVGGVLRTLSDVRVIRDEIINSGSWLRFGPHAFSFEVAPHAQSPSEQIEVFNAIYKEIDRFAGKDMYASYVRLHYYSESYELADYFKEKGVESLFSTDRPAGSYRMSDEVKKQLVDEGSAMYMDAHFIRTQFRVEFFVDEKQTKEGLRNLFTGSLNKYGYIVLYTHEYEFVRTEICDMIRLAFSMLNEMKISSFQA